MIHLLKSLAKPKLEFVCDPRDFGVIAEPVPAKNVLPDWFRKLPAVDKKHVHANNNGMTIKRCMPFLDAMTTGWILPLAATVRLEIRDEGHTVEAGWELEQVMVSNHDMHQIAGNPRAPRPPCKFHNYWTIITPPGWSCLFVPPLNRANPVFECISGVVDTDTYHSLINFPFVATAPDGVYTLERGTPLVQVIPFRRDAASLPAEVRAESKEQSATRERILRQTRHRKAGIAAWHARCAEWRLRQPIEPRSAHLPPSIGGSADGKFSGSGGDFLRVRISCTYRHNT